eukprot:15458553-Alexandrium_andersonii.AAC.1
MRRPAQEVPPDDSAALPTCCRCAKAGKICGANLDPNASHAVHCRNGPCANNRHNAVGRAIGALLKDLAE